MEIRHPPEGGTHEDPSGARETSDSNASTRTAFSRLAPRDRNPGDSWAGLRIVDVLGRGGFGCVYRAWDETLAREVALKILRISSGAPDLASEVLNEGRLLARVRHRNVVTVYGAQQIGDEIGLWMELVHGRSLSDIVGQDGPMGAEEAIVIGSSLARALAAVHGAGLLHRDVKANNVMREAGGRILLMDFGAGRDVAPAVFAARGDLAGTPIYMAPEVLTGAQASPASDLYSLGVLLFFLVTGRFPVEGRSVSEVLVSYSQGRRVLSDLRPDLPDAFVRVVERALASNPALRYQTAGTMLRDLMEAAGDARQPGDAFPRVTPGSPSTPAWTPRTPSDAWRTDSAGALVPAATRSPLLRLAGMGAAIVLSIWMLGLLMTAAFDQLLGRGAYSTDTPLDWLGAGLRSLLAPTLYAVLAILALRLAVSLAQGLARVVPALAGPRDRLRGALTQLKAVPPSTVGQVIVVLQVVAIAAVWFLFYDLIVAFTAYIDTSSAATFEPLRPSNENHQNLYRLTLTLVLLAMAAAWYYLWTAQPPERRPDRITVAAGLGLLLIVLLMLEVPYRILYDSYFDQVEFDGARCFQIGETSTNVLLHCPHASPPRNSAVAVNDPRTSRVGMGNLFAPNP